jgi:hypothetical protein
VLPAVSNLVRAFIVKKGLNPDYVPPPRAPEPTVKDIFTKNVSYHKLYAPAWVEESFKNPAKHPVLISRAKLREAGLKDKSLEALKAVAEVEVERNSLKVAHPTPALEVTEVGGDAINNLRNFMKEMDVLIASEKPAKRARKVEAKKVAKSKASKKEKKETATKVSKHFGGSFRRVSEE